MLSDNDKITGNKSVNPYRLMISRFVFLWFFCSLPFNAVAEIVVNVTQSKPVTIRIGVQATGTLAWELAILEAGAHPDFHIKQQPLGNAEAGKIALLSGSVDMIVGDWIWVAKMRSEGGDLSFYPYSTTSGALMVAEKSPIHSISDLKGKRIGIAGGELDKNWLFLQALAQQEKIDLSKIETVFGAPPLIDEQLKQGRVDAALNYWHFGAKLEAQGYRQVINGRELIAQLGIKENVPALGYVFKQSWARQQQPALTAFLTAAKNAKKSLCTDDKAWQKITPLLQANDLKVQNKLRERYCEGEIKHWGDAERKVLGRLYTLLKQLSQNKLTGKSEQLPPEMFWVID